MTSGGRKYSDLGHLYLNMEGKKRSQMQKQTKNNN